MFSCNKKPHKGNGMAPQLGKDNKLDLERYGKILGYLQYENTIYWSRLGFIFASQAALLGFSVRFLVNALTHPSYITSGLAIGLAVVGLLLCRIGRQMVQGGLRWLYRWERLLREIEPFAYGDLEVLRNSKTDEPGTMNISVRNLANKVLDVFIWTWIVVLTVVLLVLFFSYWSQLSCPA